MRTSWSLAAAGLALVVLASSSAAQPLLGALAVDQRQGDQWGWAVDYETAAAAQERALRECGAGCSVVLTFGRCAAYAADQDADSTAVGWAEAYASGSAAQQAALAECRSRGGGSRCIVRAWGCNGPVVEEGLNLNPAARRRIQQRLAAGGFDPGGADGLFGPRTRAAIRRWQSSRGVRSTGYLDGASAEALRTADGSVPAVAGVAPSTPPAVAAPRAPSPPASAAQENLFWQSIMNSTNPADFEAYLQQFPNGVFRGLAQNRLVTLRQSEGARPAGAAARAEGAAARAEGAAAVPSGRPAAGSLHAGSNRGKAGDARRRPGDAFDDCDICPEVVVLPGGDLALGRYEVTVGEYQAFASATGGGAGTDCDVHIMDGDSWRNPGFRQTRRHPVTCVSWNDAQAYLAWLSRTTGATYRLPTEAEWLSAVSGAAVSCGWQSHFGVEGTCPVGAHGRNEVGLADMVGNVGEWMEDCSECEDGFRRSRGDNWTLHAVWHSPDTRSRPLPAGRRSYTIGFRVARTLP